MSCFRRVVVRCTGLGLILHAFTSAPAGAQVRVLTSSGDLRITGNFTTIAAMATTPKGVIAISEDRTYRLTFYSPGGKQIGETGRRGGGPGEYSSIAAIGARGETFWVSDPLAYRITYVKPDGTVLGTMPAPAAGTLRHAKIPYIRPTPFGVGVGDTLIVVADREPSAGVSPFLGSMGFGGKAAIRLLPDSSAQLLARTEASPACAVVASNAVARVPFCAAPLLAVRGDGRGVVVVQFEGETLSPVRVHFISNSGDTVFTHVIKSRGVSIPRDTVEASLRPLRNDARYRSQVIAPRYYPPVRRVIAGGDGSVWLEEHQPTTAHQWLVLGPNGRPRGRVTVPANVRIMSAVADTFWGVELDEDDVPTIVRHRVK